MITPFLIVYYRALAKIYMKKINWNIFVKQKQGSTNVFIYN